MKPVASVPVKPERTRHAQAPLFARATSRPATASVSMDPETLYSMLQHSPTLDNNATPSGRGAANGAH
jgi:hypothetical protein